jgi:hypothetical protein
MELELPTKLLQLGLDVTFLLALCLKVNPDFSLINPFDLLTFDVDLAFIS